MSVLRGVFQLRKSYSSLAITLFFIALSVCYIFVAPQYGYPTDEPAEQVILLENMKEYAYFFGGEESDAYKYYDAKWIDRISESVESDHGESAYYPFVPLLNTLDAVSVRILWRIYTSLFFLGGCVALYFLLKILGLSKVISALTVLCYVVCPRFFAEGHYNNKDMVLLSLVFILILLGIRTFQKPTFCRAVIFSAIGAITANTKFIGLFLWGLIGVLLVVRISMQRAWCKSTIRAAIFSVVTFFAIYLLITPSMWSNPFGYISHAWQNANQFSRWDGVVLFRSEFYKQSSEPLPRYYLPYMMMITTPLFIWIPIAIGQCKAFVTIYKGFKKGFENISSVILLVATCFWLIPIAYALITRPTVYNGWRHFYFSFSGLAVLMGYGLNSIYLWLKQRKNKLYVYCFFAVTTLSILFNCVLIYKNLPYEHTYYNPLMGYKSNSHYSSMELDYWNLSALESMEKLAEVGEQEPIVIGVLEEMSWHALSHGYETLSEEKKSKIQIENRTDAPFLFVNTMYGFGYGVDIPEGYTPLFTVESYNQVLSTVFVKGEGQ